MLEDSGNEAWASDVRSRSRIHWASDPAGGLSAGSEPLGSPGALSAVEAHRYREQPWMGAAFSFDSGEGADLLEIGVGLGTDLARWARAGARVTGIDLTPRCVDLTRKRLGSEGLTGDVRIMDAERLDFPDDSFDIAYSFGVLHHVPDPSRAFREIRRVLRPGGVFLGALYNRHSYFVLSIRARRLLRLEYRRESWTQRLARVEHGDSGAAPHVRLFTRRELSEGLEAAGFREISIHRRHLGVVRLRRVLPSAVEEALGRAAGWYLVHEAR